MKLPKLPVRRQYLRIAARAVREGRVGWVVRQGLKTLSVPLSAAVGRPLAGPLVVNFLITYRCDSRCFMCDWPRPSFYRTRGSVELDTAEAKRVIDEVAALGAAGLNLTGGEPTLRDDCFELAAHAKSRGLFVNVNSNGQSLSDPGRVDALLAAGVDAVNLSVDGACAETHDRLRGQRDGFERVRQATALILARRRAGRPTVTYMFVVGPDNHSELPAFVALARARGVDAVSFLPLLDIFEGHRAPLAPSVAAMESSVAGLIAARRAEPGDFIENSEDYLSLFGRSWRGEPSPLRCFVPWSHLAIDAYGNVYPCGVWLHQDRRVGSARETSLPAVWRSAALGEARRELADCRACYWNCHAEANLLYQGVRG